MVTQREVATAPAAYVEGGDDFSSTSSDEDADSWIDWWCSIRGNEYYCRVDSDFILDRFNLTGLGHDVPEAQKAYNLIIDEYYGRSRPQGRHLTFIDEDSSNGVPPEVDAAAKVLYGLIHARYIICPNGLHRMVRVLS